MIEYFERLAFLKLSEGERKRIEKDIEDVLKAFEILDSFDKENEIALQPVEVINILREDEEGESLPEYLGKYKDNEGFVKGPRTVVEEE